MEKKYFIVSLYKFVSFPDYVSYKPKILNFCSNKKIKGTILLAEEGINATIAGEKSDIFEFLEFLRADDRFSVIDYKESYADEIPFHRMKVKLKK